MLEDWASVKHVSGVGGADVELLTMANRGDRAPAGDRVW